MSDITRTLILLGLAVLFFLAQRFWLVRANQVIDRIGSPRWRRWWRGLLAAALVFIIFSFSDRLFFRIVYFRLNILSQAMAFSQLWLFFSSLAFLAVKAVHALEWLWTRLPQARVPAGADDLPVDSERRKLFHYVASLAACVPFGAGIYGFASERLSYTVQRVDLPVANLPPALEGLRIVHMSDIHIGEFMPPSEIRRAVAMANDLGAELAVLTGDYVTTSRDPASECIAELAHLRAPLGVWGCNGNHEIYAYIEDEVEELFHRHGMCLLRQDNVRLQWRGANFNLIGVDYQREFGGFSGRRTLLVESEHLVRRDMPNILLSHNPNAFPRAAQLGIEAVLSGHTHGGQIQLEIVDHLLSPARFITNFIAGHYELPLSSPNRPELLGKKSSLYVNRGLGTIGIPARIGAKPEITLHTLRRA
jgi:predicted MPP superfamily phosphohydrolase